MREETRKKYEKIEELIRDGLPTKEAVAKVGVSVQNFYSMRQNVKKDKPKRAYNKKPKSSYQQIPFDIASMHQMPFSISGSPAQIAEFIRSLGGNS